MQIEPGTRLLLRDQLEGWFPLAPPDGLEAVVSYVIPASGVEPFYVVDLSTPLEVQEKDSRTPSGFVSVTYEQAVIKSRRHGAVLGEDQVSVYLLLLPPTCRLPITEAECLSLPIRAWASCTLVS